MFDTKAIRAAFVSKVYSILVIQLVATSLLIALFTFHQPTKNYFQANGEYYVYGAMGLGLVVYMVLICVESARRSTPWNYLLLILLTVAYGFIAAALSARFNTITVLTAFGATAIATTIVMLLAKYSSLDMTTCGCGLCVLAMCHLLLGILLIVILVPLGYAQTASLIIAGLGAFLVSLYMMFDLQMIMGGRSMELSPEEYILGAVLLYIDIIHLFQYMLILFARD